MGVSQFFQILIKVFENPEYFQRPLIGVYEQQNLKCGCEDCPNKMIFECNTCRKKHCVEHFFKVFTDFITKSDKQNLQSTSFCSENCFLFDIKSIFKTQICQTLQLILNQILSLNNSQNNNYNTNQNFSGQNFQNNFNNQGNQQPQPQPQNQLNHINNGIQQQAFDKNQFQTIQPNQEYQFQNQNPQYQQYQPQQQQKQQQPQMQFQNNYQQQQNQPFHQFQQLPIKTLDEQIIDGQKQFDELLNLLRSEMDNQMQQNQALDASQINYQNELLKNRQLKDEKAKKELQLKLIVDGLQDLKHQIQLYVEERNQKLKLQKFVQQAQQQANYSSQYPNFPGHQQQPTNQNFYQNQMNLNQNFGNNADNFNINNNYNQQQQFQQANYFNQY